MNRDDIGKRVMYTDRSGRIQYGTIRGMAGLDNKMVDVRLDNKIRDVFYIPDDMLKLLPKALDDVISE